VIIGPMDRCLDRMTHDEKDGTSMGLPESHRGLRSDSRK